MSHPDFELPAERYKPVPPRVGLILDEPGGSGNGFLPFTRRVDIAPMPVVSAVPAAELSAAKMHELTYEEDLASDRYNADLANADQAHGLGSAALQMTGNTSANQPPIQHTRAA